MVKKQPITVYAVPEDSNKFINNIITMAWKTTYLT